MITTAPSLVSNQPLIPNTLQLSQVVRSLNGIFPAYILSYCLKQDLTVKKSVSKTWFSVSLYPITHGCFPMVFSLPTQPLPLEPHSNPPASPCLLPSPFYSPGLVSILTPCAHPVPTLTDLSSPANFLLWEWHWSFPEEAPSQEVLQARLDGVLNNLV